MMQCQGLFGRLFGHKHEPVYVDEGIPEAVALAQIEAMKDVFASGANLRIQSVKTYIGHVCTRCGHTVNKA